MNKLSKTLLILFELILIFNSILYYNSKQRTEFYLSLLTILLLLMPFVFSHIAYKKKLQLPHSFKLVFLIFIFLALYLGEILNFYDILWWWDLMLHGVFGFYIVTISYYLLEEFCINSFNVSINRLLLFKTLFSFCLAVSLGVIWELLESTGDYFFNSKMVKGGLEDTAGDLIVKMIAAFIASVYYHFKYRKSY